MRFVRKEAVLSSDFGQGRFLTSSFFRTTLVDTMLAGRALNATRLDSKCRIIALSVRATPKRTHHMTHDANRSGTVFSGIDSPSPTSSGDSPGTPFRGG